MLRHLFACAIVIAWQPVMASADVIVHYTSTDDLDPSTRRIELAPRIESTSIDIALSATSATGVSLSTMGFCFSAPGGLILDSYHWLGDLANPDFWFAPTELPCPFAVSFGALLFVPPSADSFAIATLHIALDDVSPGTHLRVDAGPPMFDTLSGMVFPTPESEYFDIFIVPEPANVPILLLALSLIARRGTAGAIRDCLGTIH